MEKLQLGSSRKDVDEQRARELFESVRWPEGPMCLQCVAAEDLTG
ncbi:MAG: hypothetical protein O6918_01075 [Deltaproteobacteria bacterium]|nr:hypothetical protein [Deltaproteobacteria bacterium]